MRRVNKRDIGVTKQQLALLHVAKKELTLEDADYRSILELYGGVASAKFLTLEGFERVMAYLASLGFQSSNIASRQPQRRPYQDADGLPYPAQLSMMEHYFTQLGLDSAERRRGFCQRVVKKALPQTRGEVNKVIEGLKAILARNNKRQYNEGK